jgi:hypothetical protein
MGLLLGVGVGHTKQKGWVNGDVLAPAGQIGLTSRASDALPAKASTAVAPSATINRGRTNANYCIKPPPIVHNLARRRFLMNATFATLHKLEMLHRIREIRAIAF